MDVRQGRWNSEAGWKWTADGDDCAVQLVLAFGAQAALVDRAPLEELARKFPNAQVVGCSTEAEIEGAQVSEGAIVATAIRFEHTSVHVTQVRIVPGRSNHEAGVQLAELMAKPELAHLFVISSAVDLELGELTKCLTASLPRHVALTGAVAHDVCFHGRPMANALVAIGFYGQRLHIGYGALDGKDPFGAESRHGFGRRMPELAILTSSANSKRAPTQKAEEEARSVRQMLGPNVALTGFSARASMTAVTTLREE